jgi:centromeric protein E
MSGSREVPGIIPLAVSDVFQMINSQSDRVFKVTLNYIEVYKEQVKDLLVQDSIIGAPAEIRLLNDAKSGVAMMVGQKDQVITSAEETMKVIQNGEIHRHYGATNMNETSSRAHTLVRLTLESFDNPTTTTTGGGSTTGATKELRRSTLNLIDLAGSENSQMTGSTGTREIEGKFINQSLLTLSTIIQRLSEAKSNHLPFRDSKLTR